MSSKSFRFIAALLILVFLGSHLSVQSATFPSHVDNTFISGISPRPLLCGIKLDANNPFKAGFMFDSNGKLLTQHEIAMFVEYFLSALTMPDDELWVNLTLLI